MDTESIQHRKPSGGDVAGNAGDVPASEAEPKTKLTSGIRDKPKASASSEFVRAESEDDDGYDPYSDRRPEQEPLFEQDPWA